MYNKHKLRKCIQINSNADYLNQQLLTRARESLSTYAQQNAYFKIALLTVLWYSKEVGHGTFNCPVERTNPESMYCKQTEYKQRYIHYMYCMVLYHKMANYTNHSQQNLRMIK